MCKNILIIGVSLGLGYGMVVEFVKQGCNLVFCVCCVERFEELKVQFEGINFNIKVFIWLLDVNDYDVVFSVFKVFCDDMGMLDWVIVNVGMGKGVLIGIGYFYVNK